MNYVKLIFKPKNCTVNEMPDEMFYRISDYFNALFHNGQIQREYEFIETKEFFFVFVTLIDVDSLDEKYHDVYGKEYREKVEKDFEISIETIGENSCSVELCACESHPFYVLFCNQYQCDTPFICGNCAKNIPIYKLPVVEHLSAPSWANCYKMIDELWMACLDDKYTRKQLNNYKSALSKQGREICKEYEKATGKKVFYYLFDVLDLNTDKGDLTENCPSCDKAWRKDEKGNCFCDDCRLCTKLNDGL